VYANSQPILAQYYYLFYYYRRLYVSVGLDLRVRALHVHAMHAQKHVHVTPSRLCSGWEGGQLPTGASEGRAAYALHCIRHGARPSVDP